MYCKSVRTKKTTKIVNNDQLGWYHDNTGTLKVKRSIIG